MKLPNKYGSVTKLSGSRRKPFMVRICSGTKYNEKTDGYEANRVVLGYFSTKKEALEALADYNKNPFNIDSNNITFEEVYQLWKKKNYEGLSKSSTDNREAAYKYCIPLYKIKVKDLRTNMLQEIIDSCPHGSSTKKNIKTVMRTVFDYSLENNLVNRDYTEYIKIEYSEPVIDRQIFTEEEIDKLWSMSDQWDIKIMLILIYNGMRVNELLKNKRENCNLEEKWIYVPEELAKNKSSIRYVPIHDRIFPLVKYFYDMEKDNLIVNDSRYDVSYNNFVARNLKKINDKLKTTHRFHDTRHTFATLGHQYKMDELSLKKILGHSPDNITQKIYTHITVEEMRKELNKIQ